MLPHARAEDKGQRGERRKGERGEGERKGEGSTTRVGWREIGEVSQAASYLPFLTTRSRTLVWGKVASEDVATVAGFWRQQKSPHPSVPCSDVSLTMALSKC